MLPVEVSLEGAPSVLWDALVLPDGKEAVDSLMKHGFAHDFVRDQYRHCKPMLVLGAAEALLKKLGIPRTLPGGADDPGLLFGEGGETDALIEAFMAAVGGHRHFAA